MCAQAPGRYIPAAWVGSSNTVIRSISGTSMAAPHVSGVAAQLLGEDSSLSLARVKEIILAASEVNYLSFPANAKAANTPNRLLIGGAGMCCRVQFGEASRGLLRLRESRHCFCPLFHTLAEH